MKGLLIKAVIILEKTKKQKTHAHIHTHKHMNTLCFSVFSQESNTKKEREYL